LVSSHKWLYNMMSGISYVQPQVSTCKMQHARVPRLPALLAVHRLRVKS
jgi:hypothetical protein